MISAESESPTLPADPEAAADIALVGRMAAGDERALAAVYDRWAGRLYSIALQIVKQPDHAEDVLEETFWQVWRGAGAYSPARRSVATWLLTVARRRSLERLRARARPRDVPLQTIYGVPDLPEDVADHQAPGGRHARFMEKAIRDLPDAERDALELAYFHGLGQAEISERLDQPLGDVRTRLRLAMQKVRESVAPVISGQERGA
jgi:RNA polymerase sigma-70 factor, ECF subfamily